MITQRKIHLIGYSFFIISIIWKQYWFINQLGLENTNESFLLLAIGSALLWSLPFCLVKGKHLLPSFIIGDFILSFILFSDQLYYGYFGDFITIPVLSQSTQMIGIRDSITNLIQLADLKVFLPFLGWALLILIKYKRNKDVEIPAYTLMQRGIFLITTTIIGFICLYYPINKYIEQYGSTLFKQAYSNTAIYKVVGIVGFHGYDIKKYVDENILDKDRLSVKEQETIHKRILSSYNFDKPKDSFYGIAAKSNVVTFQFESLQSFMIGKTLNGQEITPNLNKLMKESFYFSNIYDQTGQGRTSDAEILVNTSLHPLPTGSVHVRFPGNTFNSLPNDLRDKGYTANSFHGYVGSFWNRHLMHSSLGFENFYSIEKLDDNERLGPYLSDKSLLTQTSELIKEMKQPFYAYIIGVTSHHPFTFITKSELPLGEYEGTQLGRYLKSVHYVDEQVGIFIQQLKESGLWDSSTFILYGDHNSEIFNEDKDNVSKFLNKDPDSLDYLLGDKQIPLFIHTPNQDKPVEVSKVGGLINVSPTLYHLLGEEKPEYMLGDDLLSDRPGYVVFRNGGFIYEDTFYNNDDGSGACYSVGDSTAVDKEVCEKILPSMTKHLDTSDAIITNNLMEKRKKEN